MAETKKTGAIPSKEEVFQALSQRHGRQLQEKFEAASVAVCGLGGLGSNIAIALARAGVGRLHLMDFDRVDLSNINRQQYTLTQIGLYKTEALADTIGRIAPYTQITTDTIKITEYNAEELLKREDIICEAFDSAEDKAMLVNYVLERMPDKYLVSGSGMAGLSSANDVKTRKVTDRFYLCGDGVSDIADGMSLFAPRVMACASHQAHMVLRIIAGETEV